MTNFSNSDNSKEERAENLAAEARADKRACGSAASRPPTAALFYKARRPLPRLQRRRWRCRAGPKRIPAILTRFARKSRSATTNPSSACRIGSASPPSPRKTAA